MKIAVLGAGAMGSVIGGLLARAGNDVVLVDVRADAVDAINTRGLALETPAENRTETVRVRATTDPATAGTVELLVVFVKCYHTRDAVIAARPMIGLGTTVLSLQNGWGNGPVIAELLGRERLVLGVCYHSATLTGPGQVRHVGRGQTFIGEWKAPVSARVEGIASVFNQAGIPVTPTDDVLREIWGKLALNACTLPTSALLRLYAPQLLEHEPMVELMRNLLREVVTVAAADQVALDYEERWRAIAGLLERCAPTTKSSMFQDVENRRRTEIDVINGAIVALGRARGVPAPFNEAMVALVKALEGSWRATG